MTELCEILFSEVYVCCIYIAIVSINFTYVYSCGMSILTRACTPVIYTKGGPIRPP